MSFANLDADATIALLRSLSHRLEDLDPNLVRELHARCTQTARQIKQYEFETLGVPVLAEPRDVVKWQDYCATADFDEGTPSWPEVFFDRI